MEALEITQEDLEKIRKALNKGYSVELKWIKGRLVIVEIRRQVLNPLINN